MRLKWAMVVVALCLLVAVAAVAWAAGQAKVSAPEVIRAQRFELVDGAGRMRATLGVAAGIGSSLLLYDEKGNALIRLAAHPGGAGLAFASERGNMRAGISVGPDDAQLVLAPERGAHRLNLAVGPDAAGLALSDEKGKLRVFLNTAPAGSVEGRAESSLVLFDREGKVVWSAP